MEFQRILKDKSVNKIVQSKLYIYIHVILFVINTVELAVWNYLITSKLRMYDTKFKTLW